MLSKVDKYETSCVFCTYNVLCVNPVCVYIFWMNILHFVVGYRSDYRCLCLEFHHFPGEITQLHEYLPVEDSKCPAWWFGKAIARIQATATVFMKPPPEIFATWPTEPCGGKPVPLRPLKVRQHVLFDSSFVQYASPSI